MDRLVPRPAPHKASTLPYSAASGPRPAPRKHRGLMALLRRLSPRLRRSPSPDGPWVKVEPRPPDRTSVASDHSFEAALHARYPDMTHQNNASHSEPDPTKTSRGGFSSLLTSLRCHKQPRTTPPQHIPKDATPNGHTPTQAPPPAPPATLVPPLHLISSRVDSLAKGDMTTSVVPLFTSTRPTATVQRPHTLNLPVHNTHHHHQRYTTITTTTQGVEAVGWTEADHSPPHASPSPPHSLSPPPLSSLPPQMSLYTQTASVDSIGSCSLDVNVTGTTSPATMEVLDGSQHSLRSVSIENNLSQITSGGLSSATTPVRPILKPQPLTDPGSTRDSIDASYKAPSYLGISCAVNGYNRLNRYDSSLRDGYRSRDASPARLAFSRSRDSSPMRPEWKAFDGRSKISPQETVAKIKELKQELAKFKAEFPQPPGERGRQNLSKKLSRKGSQGRSVSVDRGYLTKAGSREVQSPEAMNGHNGLDEVDWRVGGGGQQVRMVEITMTDASPTRSSRYQYSQKQRTTNQNGSSTDHYSTHTTSTQHTNGDTPDKSFIQSRIERLYGPSALGAGFRSRRSLLELEKEQRDRESESHGTPHTETHYDPDAKAPEGFPSVFRHLRPEFRTQLQVKRSNLAARMQPGEPLVSPGLVESPKRPGRVIPITIESVEPKKPAVTQPKPDLTPSKDSTQPPRPTTRGEPKPPVPHKVINGVEKVREGNNRVNGTNGSERGSSVVEVEEVVSSSVAAKVMPSSPTRTTSVNGLPQSDKVCVTKESTEKDGHYFLKVVSGVVAGIQKEVDIVDKEMVGGAGDDMNEEVRGIVLAALGKARLLISQKIRQFQGLCHKNIAASAEEEFPTTCDDLAGFWDMVCLQVEDVTNLFREIDALRANDWKEIIKPDSAGKGEVTTGRARRKPAPKPARPATKSSKTGEKSEEAKSREEARRKMMEERRRAMKEAMKAKKAENSGAGGDAVEIFVPETNK